MARLADTAGSTRAPVQRDSSLAALPPARRRNTDELLERPAERRLRIVAYGGRDGDDLRPGLGQQPARQLHTPRHEVMHRRLAHDPPEMLGQHRARGARLLGQRFSVQRRAGAWCSKCSARAISGSRNPASQPVRLSSTSSTQARTTSMNISSARRSSTPRPPGEGSRSSHSAKSTRWRIRWFCGVVARRWIIGGSAASTGLKGASGSPGNRR